MAQRRDADRLFEEFPAVPTDEWEDRIRGDLKGADYADTLLWHTRDGLTVRPYYRLEDLDRIEHVREDGTVAPITGTWALQQNVSATESMLDEARAAVEGGAERIGLEIRDAGIGDDDFSTFLAAVPLPGVGIHLDGRMQSPALFRQLLRQIKRRSIDASAVVGTLAFDPLDDFARTGRLSHSALGEAAALVSEQSDVDFRLLRAGAAAYHNAGATPVQETALVLATVSEYMASLIEHGAAAQDALERLFISVPISTSFLVEIAKMRALRLLIPQVIQAYAPGQTMCQLPIHAETSFRSMTLYDPQTNLLRATTEAASAVIGGCDVLIVRPFDSVSGNATAFGHRLARNIQHLMCHEANLDKVSDPAGGSYYVEVLTDAVARRAWAQFKEIEAQGGLIKALEEGYVQAQIRESQNALLSDVAEQRRVLLGTNRYPKPQETVEGAPVKASEPKPAGEAADVEADPLEPFREAEAFEQIRLATEQLELSPSILILPVGSPAVRSARANFAANFLACGGFFADVPLGYDTWENALEQAGSRPDLVVLAAADDVYSPGVVSSVKETMLPRLLGIVASDDPELEVDLVLNSRVDAVATLRGLQDKLRTGTSAS